MNSKTLSRLVEYSIFPLLILVVWVWGAELEWDFEDMDRLDIFPGLGLIAFVTMWWHFFVGFIGRIRPDFKKFPGLHQVSAYWVFAAFMLHPALFVSWGVDNGYELPPTQLYEDYAGDDKLGFITLGLLSLFAFLAYDIARLLHRWTPIKRIWPFIDAASDVAFVGIWIHSLSLGANLEEGWFRVFWILLGLSGIGFIAYKRYRLARDDKLAKPA